MGCRETFRCKTLALRTRAKRGNGNGTIWRAESRRACLRNAAPRGVRQNRQRGHVGILALVGRHTLRGVALHMFDRTEILLRGLFHILDRHVILEIEPRAPLTRHRPKRLQTIRRVVRLWQIYNSSLTP